MTDQDIRSTLKKLDRAAGEPSTIPELIAAYIGLNERLSDADISEGLQCDPALVAQVRGNLLAGRPSGHRLNAEGPPLRADGPEPALEPSARSAPPPPRARAAGPRPTFVVTGHDGVARPAPTYGQAMTLAELTGGTVAAVKR